MFTFFLVREKKESLKHHTCWENTIIFLLFMTGPLKKLTSRILSVPLKLLPPLGLEKESSSLEANLFQTYKHLKIEDWNESVFKLLGNATNFHLWVLEKDTGNCAYSICGRRSYYLVIPRNFSSWSGSFVILLLFLCFFVLFLAGLLTHIAKKSW